jgi:type VI protein secretion system component Hcp
MNIKKISYRNIWFQFFALILFSASTISAQSGLMVDSTGFNPKPNSSAILDISSKTKGVLFPRMNISQRTNIPSPEKGLTVYQTEEPNAGIWIFNGTDWEPNLSNLPGPQGPKGDTGPAGTPYVAPYSWFFYGYSSEGGMYMHIDGINGESLHENAPSGSIDIKFHSFGDGMQTSIEKSRLNSSHIVPYAEVTVVVGYSMAIPTIFKKHFTGEIIPEFTIYHNFNLERDNPRVFYKIDFKNVVIMTIRTQEDGDGQQANSLTFRYNAIRQTYLRYDENGQYDYDVIMSWNHATKSSTY